MLWYYLLVFPELTRMGFYLPNVHLPCNAILSVRQLCDWRTRKGLKFKSMWLLTHSTYRLYTETWLWPVINSCWVTEDTRLTLRIVSNTSTLLAPRTTFYTLFLTCLTPACPFALLWLVKASQNSTLLQYCSHIEQHQLEMRFGHSPIPNVP